MNTKHILISNIEETQWAKIKSHAFSAQTAVFDINFADSIYKAVIQQN